MVPLKHELKTEHELHENSYFQWLQLISATPAGWKYIIKKTHENTTNLKSSRVLTLEKHRSKYIIH